MVTNNKSTEGTDLEKFAQQLNKLTDDGEIKETICWETEQQLDGIPYMIEWNPETRELVSYTHTRLKLN